MLDHVRSGVTSLLNLLADGLAKLLRLLTHGIAWVYYLSEILAAAFAFVGLAIFVGPFYLTSYILSKGRELIRSEWNQYQ